MIQLHGGKFDLRSKLREGTEALAFFPRDRVLKARQKMDEDKKDEGAQVRLFG